MTARRWHAGEGLLVKIEGEAVATVADRMRLHLDAAPQRGLGDPQELLRGLGDLVALHPVPAKDQQEIRLLGIDLGMDVLAAVHSAVHPEQTGELLGQGAVVVA